MFKKTLLVAGLSAMLASSTAFATAETDMGEFTCQTLIQSIEADANNALNLIWFLGYSAGVQGTLTFETDVKPFITEVLTTCASAPEGTKVIEVVENM